VRNCINRKNNRSIESRKEATFADNNILTKIHNKQQKLNFGYKPIKNTKKQNWIHTNRTAVN